MVAADLLHKECDTQICAFVSHGPDPCCLHASCIRARLATADDPIWQAIGLIDVDRSDRRDRGLVANEANGGRNAREDRPAHAVELLVLGGLANAAIELCTSGFAKAWFRRTGAG